MQQPLYIVCSHQRVWPKNFGLPIVDKIPTSVLNTTWIWSTILLEIWIKNKTLFRTTVPWIFMPVEKDSSPEWPAHKGLWKKKNMKY